MNDETKDQMQLESYGKEAYETLKGIQRNLDPDGVWEKRIDGVKFT
jgi:FAD/FMN-containing dehydrogenase